MDIKLIIGIMITVVIGIFIGIVIIKLDKIIKFILKIINKIGNRIANEDIKELGDYTDIYEKTAKNLYNKSLEELLIEKSKYSFSIKFYKSIKILPAILSTIITVITIFKDEIVYWVKNNQLELLSSILVVIVIAICFLIAFDVYSKIRHQKYLAESFVNLIDDIIDKKMYKEEREEEQKINNKN